jgi:DNA-3-methyladenine glycosylase II
MKSFHKSSFKAGCLALAQEHVSIQAIVSEYGFPPMFERPLSFETLVKIILEQQVSLASGRAVFNRGIYTINRNGQ